MVLDGTVPPALGALPLAESTRKSCLAQLLPGMRIGVRFAGDPDFVQERLLGWPSADQDWVILTADDDEYVATVDDWEEVMLLAGRNDYPDNVKEEDQPVQFE